MAIDDLLHSQVALYGEIDDQVVEARRGTTAADAAVVATAEAFLPGSTGFGQAGWLGDLTTFLNGTGVRRSGQSRFEFPTFADATGIVAGAAVGEPGSNRSGTPRSIPFPKAQVRRSIFDPARDPALARSVYASVILEKLYRIRNPDAADPRGRADPVANLFAATPSIVNSWADAHGPSRTDSQTLDLLTGSLDGIRTRMEWMDFAGTNFGPAFADTSKACFGTLEDSDGLYCSTIYTDSTAADVSVDQIAQIIDPVNWPYCSQFFAEMSPQVPACDRNGWTRLVESIGAETAEYTIETALVFHFTDNRASATNDESGAAMADAAIEPHSATPRLTPTCLLVEATAEAAPARSNGIPLTAVVVTGALTIEKPTPKIAKMTISCQTGAAAPIADIRIVAAVRRTPAATSDGRGPYRPTSRPDSGENTSEPIASGR